MRCERQIKNESFELRRQLQTVSAQLPTAIQLAVAVPLVLDHSRQPSYPHATCIA